ncbi:uncharacterized protein B0H18DRAFT_1121506 [Fomitopsis serialis]|uniref:uncharacterized protein n=1 Tax=Fomitopsis serialis TaxID=139415 RepID=UPI002008CAC3|nr:uncharacterized protein B0H18DRAFT_1128332 [Neoantrodia serialis]XP_047890764.1 uncharacterized protein B0H18DRAFT_1121506 [Neoantrodia serialis]KAH9911654.1 hypothetical protein B0H18DRAFT_1128332 [Neoantrodia serialis]KAH9921361.1 hypothetical protein B0H18DRAFT_1121506 [Neoantrodia serialis]
MSGGGSESESDLTELSDDEEDVVPEPESSPAEESEYEEFESDGEQSAYDYLNAPLLDYEFERGESVWVYAYDGWYFGSVMRRAETPERPKVMQYRVLFRRYVRIQKDFAPMDGTIKPDTPRMRQMLRVAKFLQ